MKRKLCLVLTLVIAMTVSAVPSVSAATVSASNRAAMLYGIGALSEDYSDRLGETVTRSELARVAVELRGYDAESLIGGDGEVPTFTDVHPMSLAGSYITAAAKMGLMNGYGTAFGATDPVRYEDAVRVLFRTIGYGNYAENVVGLYRAIGETGIARGVTVKDAEALDRQTLLKLAENTLEIDLMYAIDTGEGTDYVKETDVTLLNTIHHITKISGKITANEYTALHSGGSAQTGEVRIDNDSYAAGTSGAAALIGCAVDAWVYDIDGDNPEIKYVEEKKNSVTSVFDAEEYAKTSGDRIYYYVDGKSEYKNIVQTADVIYNERFLCKFYDMDTAVLDAVDYGEITLKDTDGDDAVDVVMIRDIKTDYVTAFDSDSGLLVCDGGNYDLSDAARDAVEVTKDGRKMTVGTLTNGGALEIRESADGALIFINIVTKSVIGVMSECTEDNTVTINGTEYTYIAAYSAADFVPGRTVKVYVSGNRIVYISDENVDDTYVYGLVADIGTTSGLNRNYQMKIYDQTGTMRIYAVADRFRLDGESETDGACVKEALGGVEEAKLIRFKCNADGNITDIDTPLQGENEDSYALSEDCSNQSLIYKTNKTFGNGMYYVGGDTIFFSAPDDVTADERYFMQTTSSFSQDVSYTVSAYDADEYHMPKVMVVQNSAGMINGDNSIIVVEKITQKTDADGTVIYAIYGGTGGTTGQTGYYYKKGGECIPSLKAGDVIQVSAYATGELTGYKVLVDSKTEYGCTSTSAKFNYCYGTIERYDKVNGICVINTVESGAERERISVIGTVRGYRVTEEKGVTAVRAASVSDLIPGKRIYVRERYLSPAEYVVFDE